MLIRNRRARHDYSILDSIEAGLVLQGTEVKSLRQGKANIKDGFAQVREGEVWLYNMHISPYEQGNRYNHDPERPRKLLLSRAQIRRLTGRVEERGLTLIPLKIYFKNGWAKIELGLARGKKEYDKRHDMARRDAEREVEQALKQSRRA